jgi:hypothetical protein
MTFRNENQKKKKDRQWKEERMGRRGIKCPEESHLFQKEKKKNRAATTTF